jgi:hypothetical protein
MRKIEGFRIAYMQFPTLRTITEALCFGRRGHQMDDRVFECVLKEVSSICGCRPNRQFSLFLLGHGARNASESK